MHDTNGRDGVLRYRYWLTAVRCSVGESFVTTSFTDRYRTAPPAPLMPVSCCSLQKIIIQSNNGKGLMGLLIFYEKHWSRNGRNPAAIQLPPIHSSITYRIVSYRPKSEIHHEKILPGVELLQFHDEDDDDDA